MQRKMHQFYLVDFKKKLLWMETISFALDEKTTQSLTSRSLLLTVIFKENLAKERKF